MLTTNGDLICFAASFGWAVLVPLLTGVPLLVSVRRSGNMHWAEQARRWWPLRRHFAFCTIIPIGACLGSMLVLGGASHPAGAAGFMIPVVGGFLLGGMLRERILRRLVPLAIATRPSRIAVWLVRVPWLLFLAGIVLQTGRLDLRFLIIVGMYLTVMLLMNLGCHLGLLEGVGVLMPGGPVLTAACHQAADQAALPRPRIWEIADSTANAFALPFQRAVLATTPLIEALNAPQLAAICRHEMAHLAEPLRVHLPKLLAPLYYAFLMTSPTWSRLIGRELAPLAMFGGVLVYLGFVKWLTAGAHRRETQADRAAVPGYPEPAV